MNDSQADTIALYGVPGVGAKTFARLVARVGSAGAVFTAPDPELRAAGAGEKVLRALREFDRDGFVRDQEKRMARFGAVVVTRDDPEYPPLLNRFASAPPVLFLRGDPGVLSMPALAFVGTRRPTAWGEAITGRLASGAVRAGYCVVSGMAAGIDTAAHRAALDENGKTAAVFGCGVDVLYPVGNRGLAEDIAATGCLVSHFPMGTRCSPGNFPARNAVVVGLSQGVIVTEAPSRSGALITAEMALKARCPLFAVPGNADSDSSEGTNSLLARGAHPVARFEQILSFLGRPVPDSGPDEHDPEPSAHLRRRPASPPAARPVPPGLAGDIVTALSHGPLQVEVICARLGQTIPIVLTELTLLEMDGLIRQRPGKVFERV